MICCILFILTAADRCVFYIDNICCVCELKYLVKIDFFHGMGQFSWVYQSFSAVTKLEKQLKKLSKATAESQELPHVSIHKARLYFLKCQIQAYSSD